SEAEKAEADKKRQEKERRRWLAQMEKASIEAEYWSALDAYNSNEKTLESYSPEMIGMMPDEFVRALIKKDELRFNLDLAEDKRRRLYAGKSYHESA
ncbi:hypothetical protein, partial [Klebsiella pneumoniae]|uniref:hypothetical protein n=1 Tax=Klebsiella pneumoniae TaxID=573 RepID=UPI00163D4EB3